MLGWVLGGARRGMDHLGAGSRGRAPHADLAQMNLHHVSSVFYLLRPASNDQAEYRSLDVHHAVRDRMAGCSMHRGAPGDQGNNRCHDGWDADGNRRGNHWGRRGCFLPSTAAVSHVSDTACILDLRWAAIAVCLLVFLAPALAP